MYNNEYKYYLFTIILFIFWIIFEDFFLILN